jgi:hypothetical protein
MVTEHGDADSGSYAISRDAMLGIAVSERQLLLKLPQF